MSPSSEQDKRILAGKVAAAHSSLEDIRITKSNFELIETPDMGSNGIDVDQSIHIGSAYDSSSGILQVSVEFKVSMTQGGASETGSPSENRDISKISFTVLGSFSLPSEEGLSGEEIQAFASTSGLFAVYPYAREYVQSVSMRMGLLPLTLDFLKIS